MTLKVDGFDLFVNNRVRFTWTNWVER